MYDLKFNRLNEMIKQMLIILMKFKFRQIFIFWRIIFGLNENFTVQIISCKI